MVWKQFHHRRDGHEWKYHVHKPTMAGSKRGKHKQRSGMAKSDKNNTQWQLGQRMAGNNSVYRKRSGQSAVQHKVPAQLATELPKQSTPQVPTNTRRITDISGNATPNRGDHGIQQWIGRKHGMGKYAHTRWSPNRLQNCRTGPQRNPGIRWIKKLPHVPVKTDKSHDATEHHKPN